MAEKEIQHLKCERCNRMLKDTEFFTYRSGEKLEMCKKCLTMFVDNFDEDTYLWILQKIDVPYVASEWAVLRDRAFAKDPESMNGLSVIGKYLGKMRLNQFKNKGWADSAELQARYDGQVTKTQEEMREQEEEYKRLMDEGEISEAQYKTLVRPATQIELAPPIPHPAEPIPDIGANNMYNENDFISEDELDDPSDLLTNEDKIYLSLKWGRLYKAREWVELEKLYKEMEDCFEVKDPDSKSNLILLCKTNLKQNQAIDEGDFDSFQKLSKVSDTLRKSMKFTAAQNKENKQDMVDCIGNLVVMCEREGGFIPRFATDIPQDKVDFTIRDQQLYLKRLVTEDLGFGQQIEDSIKRIMIQNEMNEEAEKHREEYADELFSESPVNDDDVVEFYDTMSNDEIDPVIDEEDGDI